MTVIVLGPADVLSKALADEVDDVVIIDADPSTTADDTNL